MQVPTSLLGLGARAGLVALALLAALVAPSAASAANPGDIIVTEILRSPSALSDSVGEWFEIFNTTGSTIDIDG